MVYRRTNSLSTVGYRQTQPTRSANYSRQSTLSTTPTLRQTVNTAKAAYNMGKSRARVQNNVANAINRLGRRK